MRKTEHSGAGVNHLKCVYSKMCAHTMLGNWQTLTKGTQDRAYTRPYKAQGSILRPYSAQGFIGLWVLQAPYAYESCVPSGLS